MTQITTRVNFFLTANSLKAGWLHYYLIGTSMWNGYFKRLKMAFRFFETACLC